MTQEENLKELYIAIGDKDSTQQRLNTLTQKIRGGWEHETFEIAMDILKKYPGIQEKKSPTY